MADPASYGNADRDVEQALKALKKGTQLIKYSRKGKPKFKNFRLSPDEKSLIWNSHGSERHLILSSVSRISPGQRTPVFKRYLRPEKDYLSFSLIYNNGERSLDLICKDKDETEVWLAGLKSLISPGPIKRIKPEAAYDFNGAGDFFQENRPLGQTLELSSNMQIRTSGVDGFRISVSSTPSCSSVGSGPDDIESLGDVYLWGEIWVDDLAKDGNGNLVPVKNDMLTPQPLETNIVLDVHQISCGVSHIALVTKQGEVFTWGEESGGRLGHGIERNFSHPRLVEFLAVTNVDSVACGEFHTCAVSASGDVYSWGDGTHKAGLLGQGNDNSHWIPKRISGPLEGLQVLLVACGTWHSALATSFGHLFTFGDGTFGALGHGDRESISYPKEVESLRGLKAIAVSCGVWHTAAIVEVTNQSGPSICSRKLFTWGDGDKYRLGHGNKDTHLVPTCVSSLFDYNIQQIACGHNMTAALTTSGHVFTMGSNTYGQLGHPQSDGKVPILVQDRLVGEYVEQISCGAHHVAVLTSKSELLTWGRGANGRLGHGDTDDRNVPTLVEALKDRVVKYIACGSKYTASICLHKWTSGADQSVCTACKQAFGFTRKRRNCYNCGLVYCHACSSKKAIKAALAPTPGKPHRVCDACYLKLKKAAEIGSAATINRRSSGHRHSSDLGSVRGNSRGSRLLLSPTVEPVKYHEVRSGGPGTRSENLSIVRASQVPSLLQLKDIAFPSSLSAQSGTKLVATSPAQPHVQMQSNSRPTSPYSRRASPTRSPTPTFSRGIIDSLKRTNDHLTQEISKLQSEVKTLKQKGEAQDLEIRKFKKTAEGATTLAANKSSKHGRAMQAIKAITDHLNDMTQMLPPEISESESFKKLCGQVESLLETSGVQASEDMHALPRSRHYPSDSVSSIGELAIKEDYQLDDRFNYLSSESNGATAPNTKDTNQSSTQNASGMKMEGPKEVMEQFEPGVYVTILQLSNGTKLFKHVRFSKRKFSEHQAEEWWKENKDILLRKYSS